MNPKIIPGKPFPDYVLLDRTKTPQLSDPQSKQRDGRAVPAPQRLAMKNERSLTPTFVVVCMGWVRLYVPS